MSLPATSKKGIISVKSIHTFCLLAIGLVLTSGCRFHFQDGYVFDYTGVQTKISTITPISGNIKQLEIDNQFGDVLVTHDPGRPMECRWEGTIWADDAEDAEVFISELLLTPTEEGELLRLALTMPEDNSALNGIKSNLLVNIPASMELSSTNAHGNTQVSHLDGNSRVANRHGNVSAKNVNFINIECAHGDVALANSLGDASITTSHGNVTVANTNALKVNATHTDILLQNAMGDVQLATTHGDIDVSNVQGLLAIENRHGEINASSIEGQIIAETTHDDVKVSGNCSSVDVDSTHGTIRVELFNTDFQLITLETTHDNIYLTLPEGSNIDLDADEEDLSSDFKSSPTGAPVELSVSHGDINVKAAK